MGSAFWAVAGALLALVVLTVTLAVRLRGERRRGRAERAELAGRLDELRAEVRALAAKRQSARDRDRDRRAGGGAGASEYLITRLGADLDYQDADYQDPGNDDPDRDDGPGEGRLVSNRVLLSATFGEPLVKALAFGHGLRRAASPESRNRIGFEVRREVRRSRKVRRREMREAWRSMRADQAGSASRTGDQAGTGSPPARPSAGDAA